MRVGLTLLKYDTLRRRIASLHARGAADTDELRRIQWGVSKAAEWVPGATCLTQALAGQYLLARQGFRSRILFGLKRDMGPELSAHAWLLSGQRVVLGGPARSMAGYHHLADFE